MHGLSSSNGPEVPEQQRPEPPAIGEPIVFRIKERIAKRGVATPPTIDLSQALVGYPPPTTSTDLDLDDPAVHRLGILPGDSELREMIAAYRSRAFDSPIDSSNVIVTCGANQAFILSLLGLVNIGSEGFLPAPYFFNHPIFIRARGAKPVVVPCREPSYQPDLDALDAAWSGATAALVVTDPSNPTGMNLTAENRSRIDGMVRAHDGWLIVDETYADFHYEPHITAPPLGLANTIVIGSFSKSLSLSGWRVGYLIGPSETVDKLLSVQDAISIAAPTASQILAKAALARRDEHLSDLLPRLKATRDRLKSALADCPLIDSVFGESAVFLWARLVEGASSEDTADYLLDKLGIGTLPGDEFGAPGYIRCAYGMLSDTDLEDLEMRLPKARLEF